MLKSIKHQALGIFVQINGHKIHVFHTGQGKGTFVFMSGHGTSCPTLDFKPLWSILSVEYKIAVVERAGYGWSEATNTSRDLDTVLEETRKALALSNIEAPFILVPHSVSGLEAIYWAQKYPNEVKAIIGLDSAIPEVYDVLKIPPAPVLSIMGFLAKIGIHKPFSKTICRKSPAAQSGYLTEADIEAYIERYKKRTLTSDMLNEAKYIRQNANKVKSGLIPSNTPIYIFISNEKTIANWSKLLSDYVSAFKSGKCMLLDCGHYVHAYEPVKIAKEINDYISGIL
jgi:pimeloyl-ACP methyl ester carboxylesterase